MNNILITGGNRGIGLALVGEFLSRGDRVFAGRRAGGDLAALRNLLGRYGERLMIVEMDVSNDLSVQDALAAIGRHAKCLDIVINNAATFPEGRGATLETIELAHCMEAFNVNALGAARVMRESISLLRHSKHPRIVNITSGAGAISTASGLLAYGTSKAALNYLSRAVAVELRHENIVLALVDPGWVRTEMGGAGATLQPEESAQGIANVAEGLTMKDTGRWFNYDGTPREHW